MDAHLAERKVMLRIPLERERVRSTLFYEEKFVFKIDLQYNGRSDSIERQLEYYDDRVMEEKKMEKKYLNDYDAWEDGKNATTLVEEILADPEFSSVDHLVIGDWGGAYEDNCQGLLDGIVDHKEAFSHVTSLFVGDMDFEECEVSWIIQGNYSKLWAAMPQLKELTIKGSTDLELGEIAHDNLESLTIICGGLGSDVIKQIEDAKLPKLKKLLLYLGVDDYGFDGDIDTIKSLLTNSDFPALTYLGLVDSNMQDEVTQAVLESKYMSQLVDLDLSCGTITDKGGDMILQKLADYPNIKHVDVTYNYFSDEMIHKLRKSPCGVTFDYDDQQEAEEWDGEIWYNPMLTE